MTHERGMVLAEYGQADLHRGGGGQVGKRLSEGRSAVGGAGGLAECGRTDLQVKGEGGTGRGEAETHERAAGSLTFGLRVI